MIVDLSKYNLFVGSDAHAYHKNIVSGVTQWKDNEGNIPFDSVRLFNDEEIMTTTLINNINKKVGKNDLFIHYGDLSFGGIDNIVRFREQIICQNIIQINGNHDQHIGHNKIAIYNNKQVEIDSLFKEIHHLGFYFKYGKYKFINCHFPFHSHDSKEYINLHGYIHSKGENRFLNKNQFDVGFDGNPNFEPYHISEVLSLLNL